MVDEQTGYAGFGWSPDNGGEWALHLARPDLSGLSPLSVTWPGQVGPPSLMQRYDALAALGYAVVRGGPEAWTWTEGADEQGNVMLAACTEVRPLGVEELPADGAEPIRG
ncbi:MULTISPECIES: DUF6303 family protein [Streptomyces]|uniref:Uncharacterized protein n=1 Tax=Streptomyces dengpaensis TaxID=2049881 RepID=A0ABM6SY83_9ACTN|nr:MULTISPECIES: DUF6303 family protein [Streptomyces]AVH59718.1 hypothetical protein C4B68_32640 [Streptomyces dengpaensis]PIB09362.1 hypothetical protein B1C81_09320 [Streptomyces sp. HG99]